MNQVSAKIYYLISTGEILTVTSEMRGCVEETTKEQDILFYPQLKDKKIDEIDFIELEYGTRESTLANLKSYSVNVESKTFIPAYFTQEELVSQDAELQAQQLLIERTSTISDYMNADTTSITDIEDYILQREQNKITGGI